MLLRGKVLGATGMLAGVLIPQGRADMGWRLVLLAGMMTGPWAYYALAGRLPEIAVPVSAPLLVTGGLIVGVGVTLASGCTSGHGVCGMARLSARSFAATAMFMLTTALTVYVMRHLIGG